MSRSKPGAWRRLASASSGDLWLLARASRAGALPASGERERAARETAGFTLIEILVAFVIAVLALSVVYRASSVGLDTGGTADRYSHALLIAESALQAAGVETSLAPGTSTQRRDNSYDEAVTVRPRPDLLPRSLTLAGAYPYEVSVDVSWREGGRARSVALSTIRLGRSP
jgi:general secretion pathway protein I